VDVFTESDADEQEQMERTKKEKGSVPSIDTKTDEA